MRYSAWEPIYEEILKDFGFDRKKDEEAARIALEIISRKGIKGKLKAIHANLPMIFYN